MHRIGVRKKKELRRQKLYAMRQRKRQGLNK